MIHKIVIADDHKVVAAGIQKLVDSFSQCEVIYTVANGKELLAKFATPRNIPDLVLLDISMPIMDGFKTMRQLARRHPDVKVIGLSMAENEQAFLKLIELGAHGFVSKMADDDELAHAITTVLTKGEYYSNEVTRALVTLLKEKNKVQDTRLSPREKELLSYIGCELTYPGIAKKMGVSAKSVDGYRNSLFNKLNVHSRTTLAMYAVANGYFEIKPK